MRILVMFFLTACSGGTDSDTDDTADSDTASQPNSDACPIDYPAITSAEVQLQDEFLVAWNAARAQDTATACSDGTESLSALTSDDESQAFLRCVAQDIAANGGEAFLQGNFSTGERMLDVMNDFEVRVTRMQPILGFSSAESAVSFSVGQPSDGCNFLMASSRSRGGVGVAATGLGTPSQTLTFMLTAW